MDAIDTPAATPAFAASGDPLDRFAGLIAAALADRQVAERLGRAGVTVRTALPDGRHVTLLLDRVPAEIAPPGTEPEADVRLEMTPEVLDGLWAWPPSLAARILDGSVTSDGPVRRFLRVFPILHRTVRTALGEAPR